MNKKISIDPITRLEGHGRIDIFLGDDGEVTDCYLIIPELRGFEKFLEGRPVEELPRITTRICGVCPDAHHAASVKTIESLYRITIPPAAQLIRRLHYNAFFAGDHITHFYALGGPDFIMGPDADPAQRNILGVINKVGLDLARKVIRMRKEAHEVGTMLGGRPTHPVGMIPGGQAKPVSREMQQRLIEIGTFMVDFARETRDLFHQLILSNQAYLDLIMSSTYELRTYYLGLMNEKNQSDFYDGHLRVISPEGKEICQYKPDEYLDHIAEKVVPWSYLKIPYLKKIGWQGCLEGPTSGVVQVAPLGMVNAADGMQTPYAQEEYERFFDKLGPKPVHATLAFHWARIIEILQATELVLHFAKHEGLTDPDVHRAPTETPSEGIGVVEAPRGVLTHHYLTDERGIVQKANLVVGTTYNYAAIQMAVKKAAQGLIHKGKELNETLLNMIEMAFRAFDPCFGCATHFLPGQMPLEVTVRDSKGHICQTLKRR
ncbi:Ni/Fe hydrogenase subunit alpha [bacterium]|nr:Ni/Fe hydrogenase subunit alpha [bacterium]